MKFKKMVLNATGTTPGINQQRNQGIGRVQEMKNPKRLTVKEREHLQSIYIISENWLISKRTSDEWLLVHRFINKTKLVPAP